MSWTRHALTVSLWSATVFTILAPAQASFSFTINPGSEECFPFRTHNERTSSIMGTFECIDEDAEAIDLTVTISNYYTGEALYDPLTGSREGAFTLEDVPENSKLTLCFQNNKGFDDDATTEFEVGFSLHVNPVPRALADNEIGPDEERALKLIEKASAIEQDWTRLLDHYNFVRSREAIHQAMNDAILSRLSRWNQLEVFLVIGMATGQVLYLRRFFENRRYL